MASPRGSISLQPQHDTFLKIFLKHQLRPNPKPSFLSLAVVGQTAVITGGNAGLGLESGRLLLSRGLAHLILAVRSLDKGEEAATPLRKRYPDRKIDVWLLDMNSYDSIRALARKCAELPRLDIAILSAGIMNTAYKRSLSTGYEETFQVNYLSTALLSLLLLPSLKCKQASAEPGRLTLVASGAALIAEFSERNSTPLLAAFAKQEDWDFSAAKKRYDTSKGLVLMLTYELSKITMAEDTLVNVVDPSFTPGTSFFRSLPFWARVISWPFATLLGTSVNNAAWRYLDAAVARGKESHGSFLSDWKINPFHSFMYTDEGQNFMDRLWNETVDELDFTEVREMFGSSNGERAA